MSGLSRPENGRYAHRTVLSRLGITWVDGRVGEIGGREHRVQDAVDVVPGASVEEVQVRRASQGSRVKVGVGVVRRMRGAGASDFGYVGK